MKPLQVAQLNEYIAKKLKDDINLKNLPIQGEVSGLSKSGVHYYFTLKDSESMIKCAIWASNARNIDLSLLENGKKINVIADISPYPKSGTYSLSVRYVEAVGDGDLMAEFNRIKEKLQSEGLFDSKYKKSIPSFPYRVGIITSATGAAIEDIKKIITSKNNFTDILIFPTQVQGITAPKEICENIQLANHLNSNGIKIDTLIVGRGGGSAEDLSAFNDESVARAIFESYIPIISAVGHESDYSISDFVADVRAETPTAAADLAVMDTYKLYEDINLKRTILMESIQLKIESQRSIVESKSDLLISNFKSKVNNEKAIVEKALITLLENNPNNILNKGYSAVLDNNGAIISSIKDITIDKEYCIRMKDGNFTSKVTSVERN